MDETLTSDEPLNLREQQLTFIEGVKAGMDYSEASALAGVNRSTSWRWRQDPAFAKLIDTAEEIHVEALIAEAKRRALRSSDRLLEFMLCNLAPDQFQRANKVEMSGSLDINSMSEADIRAELAALSASGVLPGPDDCSDLV